ncbi:MAG TPA: hypothetical protein VED37_04315 [Ktedonobacteraceae bacterium]|nr:hypothetical protein [Ktedonobacteraceae bacterium]
MHGGRRVLLQFGQQEQHRVQFALPLRAVQHPLLATSSRHDRLQETMQFAEQIGAALGDPAHLLKLGQMSGHITFGRPSACFLSLRDPLRLVLDRLHLLLQGSPLPIQAPLHLGGQMQEMPDIALMAAQRLRLLERVCNRPPAIADGGVQSQPLVLQIPQDQRPALAIDGHRGQTGPHQGTVDIDHIEVGFSTSAAILLIQGQGTLAQRNQLLQAALGLLSGALHNGADRPQAELHAQQFVQTGLNAAIAGMAFHQQRQDGSLKRGSPFDWGWLDLQAVLQGLHSFLFPPIQRLPRDLLLAAAFTQQAMLLRMGQQFADPLDTLFDCATMGHESSLNLVKGFVFFSPYLSGILFVNCHIGSRLV